MIDNTLQPVFLASYTAQPLDVRGLSESERENLIISAAQIEGQWIILTRYGDDIWQLSGFPSNVKPATRQLNFSKVPLAFRAVMKALFYRYMMRGRIHANRPRASTIRDSFLTTLPFLRHLDALKIERLDAVTPLVAATYVAACKDYRQIKKSGKPLSQNALVSRFVAVETVYELSQYTDDQMPLHPWPDTSANAMAGVLGGNTRVKTPLMPDDVFCTLFEQAHSQVERGRSLLELRDGVDLIATQRKGLSYRETCKAQNRYLTDNGWARGLRAFKKSLLSLRTACYIVLASTSGCRNHELANLKSGAQHRTEDDEGTVYHWMRSLSEKTDAGTYDWMIPEAAVRALRVMERWCSPYQAMIIDEIARRGRDNPLDPEIAEARKHRHSLFLGVDSSKGNIVRTLSGSAWDTCLKEFAKECGLSWRLSSHQFRRKFANYAAHSRFGDLRYLKQHYAHWSMDMTLGYAIDDSWGQHLDLDLYIEIQGELEDIKLSAVSDWMADTALTGGYGRAIKEWRREPENLLIFKDHSSMLRSIAESTAIRSNGHAWCTADNNGCIGNSLERSRCTGCSDSVIGSTHAPIYKHFYEDLKGLLQCKDIGEGGRLRVERDLNRCREVLEQLGIPPEDLTA